MVQHTFAASHTQRGGWFSGGAAATLSRRSGLLMLRWSAWTDAYDEMLAGWKPAFPPLLFVIRILFLLRKGGH
jgi:hypothetical protein